MPRSSKTNSAKFLFRGTTLASTLGIVLLLAHTAQAQLPSPTAADTASHPAYDPPPPEWTTGDNGGFGMGPWTLNLALNTPQSGFFVGSSTGNNGTSGDTNNDSDINTTPGLRAWGLYANSGQTASAVRDFNLSFTPGSVFEIYMDNGDVQAGGTVGFALQNSAGQDLLEVYFIGGDTQYTVHGDAPVPSSVNFTREGVRVVITLTTASTYQATLTRLVDGAGSTVSGVLRNNPGPISRLRLFNVNTGASPGNDLFFNRITYYQGRVLNTDTGRGYLNIQPAVDDPATLAGHTISMSAGLYTGTQNNNIVINKPRLTLIGAGPTVTIISRTASGTLKGIEIAPGITGTTISSLRVQGFNDGGICAMQSNHFTTITNTHAYSNTAGGNCLGGIYMNGPVNHVLISHNEAVNNTSRGIVIWNGFKTNITITHNLARNNNCCGIELQDGTASGVLIAHNTVRDNADNGIGTVGLTTGAGPNLIYSNTLINNGRFGIEVKLPSGSGMPSGDGSIVVLSNTVALTDTIANVKPGEQRDLAGIAAFRRGWLAGNADIPAGVIIQGNVVSGYQQPSASDGFGIVVEGARMTVISNTLENNDVGVQVQAGHTPYAPFTNTDGNQSNLADQYFGRGNSPVACAFYQAGNVFTGNLTNTRQVGTVTSGTVTNLNTGQTFCGIQQAIDAPLTLNGHVISVSAGIYTELVSVTKQLTLLGAQHGQDAVARTAAFVGGKADPTVESIIYTPINNPTGLNPGAADLFRVLTHNVTIDGFVFDGNNPALLTSTVQIEGVYAHARRGVTNIGPNDSFNPLNNLVLRNNVFQNFGQRGVSLANNGPLSVGNLIERNVLRRIRDQAIILFTNAYADIVSNTVKVPVGGIGLHLQNFSANNSMAWLSNTVTIITNAFGIHANLFYAPSATLLIRGNMVNADAASALPSQAVRGWGINVWSIQQGSTVIVEGNRVGLSGGRLGRGINVWNVPTNNTVRVTSNAVANSTVGVNFDNVDLYFGGGQSSTLLVTSNTITGTADGVGLRVRVSVLESDPLFGANAVSGHGLMLISDTTVVSAGVGLRVETGITSTFMASATLHNSTLRNNGIGIQVLRGALTATHNYLLTNTLGVTNTGGASVDVWLNRNAIVGNGAGITNTAASMLKAECNWYGAANGPSGVGNGSGDSVSSGVDFNPWLLSDNLNGPCSSGSLIIQKVLAGPITPTTAWQFTATVPTGTLAFTLPAGGGAVTFSGLDFGPAIVTETPKLGYVATSSCTTGATGGAAISFNLVGNVTCTFTNTITPVTTVITVTPVVTNGWFYITETVGPGTGLLPFDIVLPPPAPTLGAASARLTITNVNWRHMYFAPLFTGTLLSDVTVFEYRLRIPSASPQTPYINIGWDDNATDSNTGFRGRLVYSPPSLSADTWHIVDARNDPTPRWYTTLTGATQCTSSTPCTFEQLVAAYPNAAIHPNTLSGVPLGFIGIRVGGGSSTGTGYADGLRVGVGSQITLFNFEAAPPTTVTLTANPTMTVVGGNVLLTATVTISNGTPVADGTVVSFTTSLGNVSPITATTIGGVVTATLSSTVAGVATVTATVGSLSATALVTFTPDAPFTLTLTAVPSVLPAGSSSVLTGTATDQYGNPVADGTTISFTTNFGTLSSGTASTSGGNASVALSSTVAGVATVTATVGSLSATAQITFARVFNLNTGLGYLDIQPAIDDPQTLNGHTISVTAGLYTGTVVVTKSLAIVGAGPGQTVIQLPSPGIVVTASNVTISNTSIVGTGSDVGITTTLGVISLTVRNVHVSNFARGVVLLGGHSHTVQNSVFTLTNAITSVGVEMSGQSINQPITNVLVSDNLFVNSGIAVAGVFAKQNFIVGNQMRYGVAGVRLAGANGNLIEGNQIEDNGSYAIYLAPNAPPLVPSPVLSNSNNVISGNVVINHPFDRAIQIINSLQPGNGNQIVNNLIQNAGQAGILVGLGSGDTNLLIAGNTVVAADPGIFVGSSLTATISNNQVSGGSSGIRIANSSHIAVVGNTISNTNDGVLVNSWSSHVTVTGNVVSDAGNGFRIANSNAVTLTVNQAVDSATGFLVGSGSSAVSLSANQAQDLNIGFRVGSGAANVTLAGNAVDSTGLGLEVLNSNRVVITGNVVINSGLGLSITNGAGNVVTATFNVITSTGGVRFHSGNAGGLLLRRNNLANNVGIVNAAAGVLNAECNWYGAANGPSGIAGGSGTPVNAGVDFNPWLLSDNLIGPCGGSLTVQKVLVGLPTPATAWQFTATIPTGTLVFTLPAGGGAITFSNLDFGSATITETPKMGYSATSRCTTGTTGGASISSGLLGDVTCTFTNTLAVPTTITLAANPGTAAVNDSVLLTATVTDQFGSPVIDGTLVSFTTSLGSVSPATATTVGGVVVATLSSTVSGVATVTATVGSLSATALVTFVLGAPSMLTLTAVPNTLLVGNISTLTVTATDQFGNPVADGTTVSFTASLGHLALVTATTVGGVATATLSSTVAGIATVTATVGGLSTTIPVTFTSGAPFTFTFTLTPTVIIANGISQSLGTVTVIDQYGNPVGGATVNFLKAVGVFSPANGTTNASGQVTTVLTSLAPAIENVFAVVNGLGFHGIQVTYVSLSPGSAPLTSTLQTVTRTLGYVHSGDLITYTVTVTNTGAAQVSNVLIYAPIPSGTTYVAGSANGGNFSNIFAMLLSGQAIDEGPLGPQAALSAVTWLGSLPGGASHTLSYAVQVQITEGQVVNQFKVFVNNVDTGMNLSSAVDVVAHRVYIPILQISP